MTSKIKKLVYKMVTASRLHQALHGLLNRHNISVLMYHGVVDRPQAVRDWCMLDVNTFKEQIEYLAQHFNIVSLPTAVESIAKRNLEKPTAVITFDDGYQNNFDIAFPVLKQFNAPATIFLTTKFIDTDSTIWTGALHSMIAETSAKSLQWNNCDYALDSNKNKASAIAGIKKQFKKLSLLEINRNVEEVASSLGFANGFRSGPQSPYRMLNRTSILSMAKSDLIDYGAHTHNHPILSRLTPEQQESEIMKSTNYIKDLLGKPCRLFAYPNGSRADYDATTLAILKKNGVQSALTTVEGACNYDSPQLEWPRLGIGSNMDFPTFQLYIHNMLK